MEQFDTLVGLEVRVFLDAYEVDGVLEHLDEEKLIINDDGFYFLIFKKKVNMVLLNPTKNLEEKQDRDEPPSYHEPRQEAVPQPPPLTESELFLQNGVAEDNQYGSILPRTLLEQQPVDPIDKFIESGILPDEEEEFSIPVSTLRNEERLLSRAEVQKITGRIDDSEE